MLISTIPKETGLSERRSSLTKPSTEQGSPVDQVSRGLEAIPPAKQPASGAEQPVQKKDDLSPAVSRLLRDDWGLKVDRVDLEGLVGDCLPGSLPVLSLSTFDSPGQKGLHLQCNWLDAQADETAHWSARMTRNQAGGIDFYWGGTWCRQDSRGQGFLETLASKNLEFLKKRSNHPEDCLRIGAGSGAPSGRFQEDEIVGRYLWARLGVFDFQPDGSLGRMRESFAGWLDAQAAKDPRLSPELVSQLKQSSQKWERPEDFAEVNPPFLKFSVERSDGRIRQCSLGKAFLLDPKTTNWSGECRPNQVDEVILDRAFHLLCAIAPNKDKAVDSPEPRQVLEHLRKKLEDPALTGVARMVSNEVMAQLSGEIPKADLLKGVRTHIRPEIYQSVLEAVLEQNQEEPRGMMSQIERQADVAQGDYYRHKLGQLKGEPGPVSDAEYRKFFSANGFDWKRMDAAIEAQAGPE